MAPRLTNGGTASYMEGITFLRHCVAFTLTRPARADVRMTLQEAAEIMGVVYNVFGITGVVYGRADGEEDVFSALMQGPCHLVRAALRAITNVGNAANGEGDVDIENILGGIRFIQIEEEGRMRLLQGEIVIPLLEDVDEEGYIIVGGNN